MKLLERTAAGPDGAIEALSTRLLQRGFVPDNRTPAANTDIGELCAVTFYTQQTASPGHGDFTGPCGTNDTPCNHGRAFNNAETACPM